MRTETITTLLKEHCINISPRAYFIKLVDYNVLQHASVQSTVHKDVTRHYKRFTNFGREFGCDAFQEGTTSKVSQPRFYSDSFNELLDYVEGRDAYCKHVKPFLK